MTEESLFSRALELPAQERAAFLKRECSDAVLLARVEELLAADARSHAPSDFTSDFTPQTTNAEAPAGPPREAERGTEEAGAVVAAKYTLVEVIGEGGMGSVWRAKQTEPVKRFVAVKLIKAGMDSKQVLARFEAERQALALMDHPNIAKVLDGGLHHQRPFFVMELVKGVPITEYCDRHKLTPQQRLGLFVQVCQAIQHAHQKGIIHRDIKPSNVLIALYDDKPVVKVIDFGVAKATGGTLTEATIDTGFGGVVGTPQYMSPEQASFNNRDIDTRSDVYALGVLLYELLAGSPPFSGEELKKKGLLEILRVVREEDPPRPSTKLSTANALPSISVNRGTEPKKLAGLLRNDLDWIVMKALEKDRARRYETANGFAADVQRYLAGEPVQAHPPSTAYRLRKFVRRNKGRVTAAGLVLLALIGGVVGTSLGIVQAESERQKAESLAKKNGELAEDERKAATKAEKLADDNSKLALEERKARIEAVEATQETARQLERLRRIVYANQLVQANQLLESDARKAMDMLYDLEQAPADLRNLAWNVAAQAARRKVGTSLQTFSTGGDYLVAMSLDGKRAAAFHRPEEKPADGKPLSDFGAITLHDVPSGKKVAALSGRQDSWMTLDLLSPDGSKGAVSFRPALREPPGKTPAPVGEIPMSVMDLTSGKELFAFSRPRDGRIASTFSSDSALFAIANSDNDIQVCDLLSAKVMHVLKGHAKAVLSLQFSPDGKRLASGSSDSSVNLWDVESGQIQSTWNCTVNSDPDFVNWPTKAPPPGLAVPEPLQGALCLEFNNDGSTLAVGNSNWLVDVWDVNSGRPIAVLRGIKQPVSQLAFLRDGKSILVNEPSRRYEIATGQQLPGVATLASRQNWQLDPERRILNSWSGSSVEQFELDATQTPRAMLRFEKLPDRTLAVPVSRNGEIVAVSRGSEIELWDLARNERRATLTGHKLIVGDLAVSPDFRILASSGRLSNTVVRVVGQPLPESTVRDDILLWDLKTGTLIGTLPANEAEISKIAFSPDGGTLASICWRDGKAPNSAIETRDHLHVSLWDVGTHRVRFDLDYPTDSRFIGAPQVAFHPDGNTLATSANKGVRIWNLATRAFKDIQVPVVGGMGAIAHMQFAPDGKALVVTASGVGRVNTRMFDAVSGDHIATFLGNGSMTSDGKLMLTTNHGSISPVFRDPKDKNFKPPVAADSDQILCVDLLTKQTLATIKLGTAGTFALSADGKGLLSVHSDFYDDDVRIKLWDVGTPDVVMSFRNPGLPAFSADGRVLRVSESGLVRFLDVENLRYLASFNVSRSGLIGFELPNAISPDGRHFVYLNIPIGNRDQPLGFPKLPGKINVPKESTDPPQQLTAIINDIRTGARVAELDLGLDGGRYDHGVLTYLPDGKTLLAALCVPGERPNLPPREVVFVTWSVPDGKRLNTIRAPIALQMSSGSSFNHTFAPDGQRVALYTNGIQVYDLRDPTRVVTMRLPKVDPGGAVHVAIDRDVKFTPDGKRIVGRFQQFWASTSRSRWQLAMWDAQTGERLAGDVPDILGSPERWEVVTSPDGRFTLQRRRSPAELIDRTLTR